MTAVRDVVAQWLVYLIALAGVAGAATAGYWIAARFVEGRRRAAQVEQAETVRLPIPAQRAPTR